MNKLRRKEIDAVIDKLENVKTMENTEEIISVLEDIVGDIQNIYDDEYDYMENIPENLQGSERYEKAEEACDNLESAIDTLECIDLSDDKETIESSIDEAIDYLNEATA